MDINKFRKLNESIRRNNQRNWQLMDRLVQQTDSIADLAMQRKWAKARDASRALCENATSAGLAIFAEHAQRVADRAADMTHPKRPSAKKEIELKRAILKLISNSAKL